MEKLSMFKCCRCQKILPRNSFGGITKRNDYCRSCKYHIDRAYKEKNIKKIRINNKAAAARRYAKNRKLRDDYLSEHPCIVCGESDIVVLDFDHKDRNTKKAQIGDVLGSWNWEKILTEIQKCQVLCANCHRRRTAKQFGWYSNACMD
jgi:hypothetical protein